MSNQKRFALIGSNIGPIDKSDELADGDILVYNASTGKWVSTALTGSGLVIAETQITDGAILARVAANETISGAWTFSGVVTLTNATGALTISSATPQITFIETDAAADNGKWQYFAGGEIFVIRTANDALDTFANALLINRTGTTVDSIALSATAINFTGTLGAFTVGSASQAIYVTGANPYIRIEATAADADEEDWWIQATSSGGVGIFRIRAVNDAATVASEAFNIFRSGTTVTEIELNATLLDINANADISGTLTLGGNMTVPSGWSLTTGGGTLTISGTGETLATFVDDGACTFYYNNTARLATSSTGVDVVAGLLLVPLSATGGATFRIPHGAAPSAPVDGDIWTTTAGLYVRINGVTVGPLT